MDPTPTGTNPGLPTGAPTGLPTGTATGGTGTLCETAPPPPPATWATFTHIPASEEFAFDELGFLLNIDDTTGLLYQTPYVGVAQTLAPYNSPEVGAVRFKLAGDSLVVADEGNGALVELQTNGSTQILLGSIVQPNSLAVHRDGWIYTTAADQIWKVDPDGLVAAELQFTVPGADLDGLVLSNAYDWLYFNHDEDGVVIKARVDANGDLGAPQQILNLEEGAAELDGMAIDECDNLYVVFTDGRIYRVRPSGQWSEYVTLPVGSWTTSLHFGSGIGGWKTDHLYVMNRQGAVYEVAVGLNGKPEPHLPAVSP